MTYQNKLERLFRSFDSRYQRFRHSVLDNKRSQISAHGFKLSGNSQMLAGTFEPNETKLVREIIDRVDKFVNIGANVGYYILFALKKGLSVIAFEPEEENLRRLIKNVCDNNLERNFELFPIAISDDVGIATIYGDGTGASLVRGWSNTEDLGAKKVAINTVDNCIGDRLSQTDSLVLLDIEGFEYKALLGAKKIINSQLKPIWIVEICSWQHQPTSSKLNENFLPTFKLFWEAGYKSYSVTDKLQEIQIIDIEKAIENKFKDFNVHNFLFLDAKRNLNEILPGNSSFVRT